MQIKIAAIHITYCYKLTHFTLIKFVIVVMCILQCNIQIFNFSHKIIITHINNNIIMCHIITHRLSIY